MSVQPQLVQPGDVAAPASDAGYFLTAKVDGVSKGQAVELQTWTGDGWRSEETAKTNQEGSVTFRSSTSAWTRVVTEVGDEIRAAHVYPSVDGPQLLWSEDFDGEDLGPLWLPIGQPDLDYTCSKGDSRAVELSGGVLRLSVTPSADVDCQLPNQSGRINGHVALTFPIGYGTVGARIRFPQSRDLVGSVWLQNAGPSRPWVMGQWADGAVIAETSGTDQDPGIGTGVSWLTPEGVFLTKPKDATRRSPGVSTDGRFHVFSIDRTPEGYVFRIDGHVIRKAREGVLPQPLSLALALLSPDKQVPDDAALGQTMDVDWIRIWASPVAPQSSATG